MDANFEDNLDLHFSEVRQVLEQILGELKKMNTTSLTVPKSAVDIDDVIAATSYYVGKSGATREIFMTSEELFGRQSITAMNLEGRANYFEQKANDVVEEILSEIITRHRRLCEKVLTDTLESHLDCGRELALKDLIKWIQEKFKNSSEPKKQNPQP